MGAGAGVIALEEKAGDGGGGAEAVARVDAKEDAKEDAEEDWQGDEAAIARCDREAAESTEAILGTLSATARAALAKAEDSVVLDEYDREYERARYTPSSERETSARREAEHHMSLRVDAEASARAEEAAKEAEAAEKAEGLESTLSTLSAGAREALARVMAAEGTD